MIKFKKRTPGRTPADRKEVQTMPQERNARLQVIAAMVIFGTIGIFRKYIPLPSSLLAMARGVIGAFFLLLIKRQKPDASAIRKNALPLVFSGASLGFNWILLFESYRYTSVAVATLCYYMAPILLILVSPFLLKEKLTLKKLLCVAVALAGMVPVSGILDSGFDGDFRGILFGLGAAALYASVMVLNKKIAGVPVFDKTIVQLLSAAAVLLPYTLLTEDLGAVSVDGLSLGMLVLVGILHTGVAYGLYFGGMGALPGQTVALLSYLDPVVAILLSAVILAENIGIWGYLGAILILGAALVSEWPEKN